jgi:hypothetical protein
MADVKEKIVPPQYEGQKKDIVHCVETIDEDDARKLFVIARNRLLAINRWYDLCGSSSAKFTLTDNKGTKHDRTAEKGDYLKIDLPATPGTADGKGYDWVFIEAIEDNSDSAGPYESIALRARPSQHPNEKVENIAHFFDNDATSTFIVERHGKKVTAAVYGRNEVPNTATSNTFDKVRNVIVGMSAILGFSNMQWNNLVRGLLHT